MPKKKAATKTTMTKTAFVKSQPASLSAKEVVEKAKAAGITITDKYVYNIRSVAKMTKSAAKRGRPKGSKNKAPSPKITKRVASSGDDELAFRRLVLSIGLPKAEAYLSDLKASVGL